MESTQERLNEIKQKGYHLEFGDVFNDSLEIYKKVLWIIGLAFLILMIIMGTLSVGVMTIFFGASDFMSNITQFGLLSTSPAYLVISLIVGVLVTIAISPLYAGIAQVCHNAQTNKHYDFNTVFIHYKSSYVKNIAISALLISLVSGVATDLVMFLGFQFLATLVSYFFQFFTLFTIPFIIFGNLNAMNAIQASILIVFKKFWIIFALMLVAVIMAMLGLIAICIGILFTLPIIYTTQYAIYRNVIGVEEHDELDEIGIYKEY